MESIHIRYLFRFPDHRQEVVELYLDTQSLDLIDKIQEKLPPWTNLDFHQCPNCLLTIQTHPSCPVAVCLVKLVPICKDLLSYDLIHVDVIMAERVISKDTSAQKGISSLMGLLMATSGCPRMSFLKPMARFHLPFASAEETLYRATSMYLLAQYFVRNQEQKADLELEGLLQIYHDIQRMNRAMAKRLRSISDKDSALNALVLLDIFAETLPDAIEDSLQEIRYLFKSYLIRSTAPNPDF